MVYHEGDILIGKVTTPDKFDTDGTYLVMIVFMLEDLNGIIVDRVYHGSG